LDQQAISTSGKTADSLLDKLDKLEVVEASELQEGVAFHAFQFATP
jgi:hypothetical protein